MYHVPIGARTVIGLAVYTMTGTACMCALGLASTRICATTNAASVAGPFITLILGFISGVFIPVSMMPAWLLDASKLFPLEHLARGLRQAFAVPGSTGITAIDLAALAAWGAAGLGAALVGFRWEPHDNWRAAIIQPDSGVGGPSGGGAPPVRNAFTSGASHRPARTISVPLNAR